jgi:hypothetical protein
VASLHREVEKLSKEVGNELPIKDDIAEGKTHKKQAIFKG